VNEDVQTSVVQGYLHMLLIDHTGAVGSIALASDDKSSMRLYKAVPWPERLINYIGKADTFSRDVRHTAHWGLPSTFH